jgi:hypothetical protein
MSAPRGRTHSISLARAQFTKLNAGIPGSLIDYYPKVEFEVPRHVTCRVSPVDELRASGRRVAGLDERGREVEAWVTKVFGSRDTGSIWRRIVKGGESNTGDPLQR